MEVAPATNMLGIAVRRSFTAFAALSALTACGGEPGSHSASRTIDDVPVIDVHVDTLPADDEYGYVAWPVVLRDRLWLRDETNRRELFFHVVDLTTGRRICTFGKGGGGPGEFRSVTTLFERPGDDSTAWAWDSQSLRITGMPHDQCDPRPDRVTIIGASANIGWLYPLGPGRFVGPPGLFGVVTEGGSYYDSQRFTILSRDGQVDGGVAHAIPGSSSLPASVLGEVTSGSDVCSRRDGSGFAVTYKYAGRIQRFDSAGRFVDSLRVPVPSVERLREPNPRTGAERLDRRREYYHACAWSDDHLFAVFSAEEDHVDDRVEARLIHVFDKAGSLVRVIRLDASIGSIAVDAGGRQFYSATLTNVFRFEVPPF